MNVAVGILEGAPTWRRVSLLLALGVGVCVAAAVCKCHRDPRPTRPATIAWDGHGFLAAWGVDDDDGATVYVRRFSALDTGLTTVRGGTPIFRIQDWGLDAAPEIVSGPDGALVVAKPTWGDEVAIPLDRQGTAVGAPQPFDLCRRSDLIYCKAVCRRPVAFGDGFVVGHLAGARNHSSGFVELAFLDRAGKTVRTVYPRLHEYEADSCATAIAGDWLVVATGEYTPFATSGIQIHYLTLEGTRRVRFWIDGDSRVRALVADRDSVAVLHARNERLLVTRVSVDDGVGATIELTRSVDPTSVDLGVDAHGLYVTWLSGRTLHVLALDGPPSHRTQRTGSAPSGTRTLGAGARSVTAWTTGGRALQVFSAAR